MNVIQIPQLPVATSLNGTEAFETVQAGTSVQVTANQLANFLIGQGTVPIVSSYAGLLALMNRPSVVVMSGYYNPGDGGGGVFIWSANNTTLPDGGTVVQCTSGPAGRYLRLFSGDVYAMWFGYSAVDSTTILQTAINTAIALGVGLVLWPVLIPIVQVTIRGPITIKGQPGSIITYAPTATTGTQQFLIDKCSATEVKFVAIKWQGQEWVSDADVSAKIPAASITVAIVPVGVTMTLGSPGRVVWPDQYFPQNNTPIIFNTTGALPTGIVSNTIYYVVGCDPITRTFSVATVQGNTGIDFTGSQSGSHTARGLLNRFDIEDCECRGGQNGWRISGVQNASVLNGRIFKTMGRGMVFSSDGGPYQNIDIRGLTVEDSHLNEGIALGGGGPLIATKIEVAALRITRCGLISGQEGFDLNVIGGGQSKLNISDFSITGCGNGGMEFKTHAEAVVTLTLGTPGIVNWPDNTFPVADTPIVFGSTGSLPTGLTQGVTYYVLAPDPSTNSFSVAATVGGAAIAFSGSQSGTQSASVGMIEDISVSDGYIDVLGGIGIAFNISSPNGPTPISKLRRLTMSDIHIHGVSPSTAPAGFGMAINGRTDLSIIGCVFDGYLQTATDYAPDNALAMDNKQILVKSTVFRDLNRIARFADTINTVIYENCDAINVFEGWVPIAGAVVNDFKVLGGDYRFTSGNAFNCTGASTISGMLVKDARMESASGSIMFVQTGPTFNGVMFELCHLKVDTSNKPLFDVRSGSGTMNVWNNHFVLDPSEQSFAITGGTITITAYNNQRGTTTSMPVTAGSVGDRYVNAPPVANQASYWDCTTAGNSGFAVWSAPPGGLGTAVATSISAGVLTIDLSKGSSFIATMNANITSYSIMGAVAGGVNIFTLSLLGNGSSFTLPASDPTAVDWGANGVPVPTSTSGKKDIYNFYSVDGAKFSAAVYGQAYGA